MHRRFPIVRTLSASGECIIARPHSQRSDLPLFGNQGVRTEVSCDQRALNGPVSPVAAELSNARHAAYNGSIGLSES
jgi:hypothetical protein